MMLLALALNLALLSAPDPDLSWLVGRWCTDPGASGTRTCERWEPMKGGVMQGASETVRGGKASPEEVMRITVDAGGLVFHAEPKGQAPADFRAEGVVGQSLRFENAEHDFPQRVRYWREGDALVAEIAMLDGRNSMRWIFRRVAE